MGDETWKKVFNALSEWVKGGERNCLSPGDFDECEAELARMFVILRASPPIMMANGRKADFGSEVFIERPVLKLIEESVAKDADMDGLIRETLLQLLRGELGYRLALKRRRGAFRLTPERAILEAMKKELDAGGNLESAYAAAMRARNIKRSRAQQVAKKHGLRAATKSR